MSARSSTEIDEQIEKTAESIASGQSAWPGLSYEQGVDAALRWVTGETDEAPMDDE